jgi:hypothetical protein
MHARTVWSSNLSTGGSVNFAQNFCTIINPINLDYAPNARCKRKVAARVWNQPDVIYLPNIFISPEPPSIDRHFAAGLCIRYSRSLHRIRLRDWLVLPRLLHLQPNKPAMPSSPISRERTDVPTASGGLIQPSFVFAGTTRSLSWLGLPLTTTRPSAFHDYPPPTRRSEPYSHLGWSNHAPSVYLGLFWSDCSGLGRRDWSLCRSSHGNGTARFAGQDRLVLVYPRSRT